MRISGKPDAMSFGVMGLDSSTFCLFNSVGSTPVRGDTGGAGPSVGHGSTPEVLQPWECTINTWSWYLFKPWVE